jgi:hypothetical protein
MSGTRVQYWCPSPTSRSTRTLGATEFMVKDVVSFTSTHARTHLENNGNAGAPGSSHGESKAPRRRRQEYSGIWRCHAPGGGKTRGPQRSQPVVEVRAGRSLFCARCRKRTSHKPTASHTSYDTVPWMEHPAPGLGRDAVPRLATPCLIAIASSGSKHGPTRTVVSSMKTINRVQVPSALNRNGRIQGCSDEKLI